MKNKRSNYNFLIFNIIYIIIGILILLKGNSIPTIMILILGSIFIIKNILITLLTIIKRDKNILNTIIRSLIEIIFGVFLIFSNKLILSFISIFFSLYLFILTIINIIDLILYFSNNIKGKLAIFINIIINIIFFFLLISSPYKNLKIALFIIGVYLLLYGINNIGDFIIDKLPDKIKNKIKYQIYIPLPILLASIIPPKLIKKLNASINIESLNNKKNDKEIDLEIIIHLAENGSSAFGHVDIAFQNKIYSYGNYNRHSRKLFDAIGDGIFMIADKNKYIKYMTEKQNRYLIIYGLNLNQNQIKSLEKTIKEKIYTNTINWHSDLELALNENKEFTDMSSELYRYANAKYKKVIKGKNKKFFVFKTNCTLVAETLIRPLGRAVLPINGIITPGTYYDSLEREYNKKKSNVISKKIYYKKNDK